MLREQKGKTILNKLIKRLVMMIRIGRILIGKGLKEVENNKWFISQRMKDKLVKNQRWSTKPSKVQSKGKTSKTLLPTKELKKDKNILSETVQLQKSQVTNKMPNKTTMTTKSTLKKSQSMQESRVTMKTVSS
jgi:hypothetical protein